MLCFTLFYCFLLCVEYGGSSLEDDDETLDDKAIEGRSGYLQPENKSLLKLNKNTRGKNNLVPKTVTKNRFRHNIDCDFYTSELCLQVKNYPMYVNNYSRISPISIIEY